MTIVDTLKDAHYGSRAKLAMQFAKILNKEARELQALGANVIQFDEPAFNVDAYMDDVRDWGIETLERAAAREAEGACGWRELVRDELAGKKVKRR